MHKIKCTVGILTYNSGKTLRRALESVKNFDEIILCDGGSADDTRDIGREYGAIIIEQKNEFKQDLKLVDFAGVRNQCLDQAKNDWFLYIDSDEAISSQLECEIREVVDDSDNFSREQCLVFKVPIGIYIGNKLIKYSSNYPGYQYRFFSKKAGARFVKKVHEKISFNRSLIKTGILTGPWYIFTEISEWKNYIREGSRYRDIAVQAMRDSGYRNLGYFTFYHARAALAVFLKSIRNYVLHGINETMPFYGEFGRFCDPLILIIRVYFDFIRRVFRLQ